MLKNQILLCPLCRVPLLHPLSRHSVTIERLVGRLRDEANEGQEAREEAERAEAKATAQYQAEVVQHYANIDDQADEELQAAGELQAPIKPVIAQAVLVQNLPNMNDFIILEGEPIMEVDENIESALYGSIMHSPAYQDNEMEEDALFLDGDPVNLDEIINISDSE